MQFLKIVGHFHWEDSLRIGQDKIVHIRYRSSFSPKGMSMVRFQ